MTVRAKFRLSDITEHHWPWSKTPAKTLKFTADYDPSIPEDQRFQEATPQGNFEMLCTNPVALAQFELGKSYYFDITLAPDSAA
ncbi:hypothetical protein [Paraburkholderia caballeronis]|uniref:Uncharacterized protein n=1 Tax=Paraburkholderia caballeronis TaxID=416943 RepID=A0A1H7TZ79_9BURK|nr:hypothetical protein [Paraburkholderia caballeronis]PXW23424.1 hypothetical protein C7403_110162 [Paraburkholderia caballeronis]PXW98417.1 hypothetical protein C7407_110162 [Paraburkholderia caballeronis]RAJ95148.1 hypothetical protein C7409_110163 [Paraburkholderia caballeronis]SEC54230.1 hypothetical protein SAMN05445871_2398 [Paraburkholderia caballeronis]SEL90140.1 hypothetical protein SAMN05192542_11752 [Paraburkholderia caballeronis]